MSETISKPVITFRDLNSFEDLKQVEAVEREVWGLADIDVFPTTLAVATLAGGCLWLGAFDGKKMAGFAFGFPALDHERLSIHSHMLAVCQPYRDLDLGYRLKLAQRERTLAMRIQGVRLDEITWTFDPLQSKNAHLNFAKLGVVSESYRPDFYGPETTSVLHRNSTDRLWVRWPLTSKRVRGRIQGQTNRSELIETLARLQPLVRFNGDGKPAVSDLASALQRQRIAIEIPSDIGAVEARDPELARHWRKATRWAFTESLQAGFFVAEFCRTVRGAQGPGAYLLEKGPLNEYIPEIT